MNYRFLLLVSSMLISVNLHADSASTAPVVKKKLPIECTDSENYDMTDCEKAQQLHNG